MPDNTPSSKAVTCGDRLRALFSLLSELVKLRLTLLVLFSAVIGYYFAQGEDPRHWLHLFNMLIGTFAVASGAAVLNQLLEIKADALMHRTQGRPLPSGRVEERDALALGIMLSGLGLAYLIIGVNIACAMVAALTLVSYLIVYTPLKKVTTFNTLIGAIPGALPPVIGWSAARDDVTWETLSLFLILFFWQLPHFLAIAWMYREDYARGGFRMLTLKDASGRSTAIKSLAYAILLLPSSLIPYFTGAANSFYLVAASGLGFYYIWSAWRFVQVGNSKAKALFLSSILYLPCLLISLIIGKA